MKTPTIADIVWAKIDRHRLDEECVAQAELMVQYTMETAEARKQVEILEVEVKTLKASVEREVRKNPDQYDLLKPTETQYANVVACTPSVIEAQTELIEARRTLGVLDGLVTALSHRKAMLESLVFLHGQGYFSKPRTKRVDDPADDIRSRPKVRHDA